MHILKQALATAVLAFGVSSVAHATWMSGVYITTADPYSFTLNVAQQQNTKIESAKLSLLLSDPIDYWFTTHEVLSVKLDNKLAGTISNVDYFGGKYSFNVLPSLLSDGKLNVSLSLGCDPTCYGSCLGQDILLRDVLLAITRVPTTPAAPTTPPVSKPNPTPTPVTPPPATAPIVVVTPPATTPVNPPATTPDTTPPATAPVVVVTPPATTPTPTPDAPTSTAPVVVVTPPAFDPAGPELPVDLPDDGDATPAVPAEVPEPATLLTLGLGLLGLAAMRRRA